MISDELFDWILLLARWLHITVAVTWIGTSIFFMWLDRSFIPNKDSKTPGHVGELWMVHGGGFYRVEKMLMGPTKVPDILHWFKWESYWTFMSGIFLIGAIFYTGGGTFLLDDTISDISYFQGVLLGIFSLLGSWAFYDFLWERKLTRDKPIIGHILTLAWFVGMSYLLCKTISGRAAYIHIGGMLGTWMTLNVFMRIIPRQVKMVEASKRGEEVNQEWGKNAKNRSTHNTYFTLPVIFIMLSNHFPATYGHEMNWFVLLILSAAGASIREYFVVRLSNPSRSKKMALLGIALLIFAIAFTSTGEPSNSGDHHASHSHQVEKEVKEPVAEPAVAKTIEKVKGTLSLKGVVLFEGKAPKAKKLRLPGACKRQHKGDVYSNEVMVSNGKLQNVLIRVKKGHENLEVGPTPKSDVILDQKGCIYIPRVVGARVGQTVAFLNSDPIFHNVKSVTKNNKKFNVAMPKQNSRIEKVFKKPELFVQAKCSVHPWMSAYVAVVEHPFFNVTNEKGMFEIKGLAAGKYTIELWHETLGTQSAEVEVGGDIKDYTFTFKGN
ncbi:MAG: hypothetical protein GY909_01270 [Oligoflexia bacterium]|nr:hypothetical protein [Oligoflexia bacterium]